MKNRIFIGLLVFVLSGSCNTNDRVKVQDAAAGQVLPDTAGKEVSRIAGDDTFLLDETEDQEKGPVYMFCEKMPEFPGGEDAFTGFVRENVKYPAEAVKDKIEGRVIIKFIIRETGKYSDLKIIRSVRSDLDNECLRVLAQMPDWTPGMIGEKPVSVSFSIPIRFVLNDNGTLNGFYILPEKQ